MMNIFLCRLIGESIFRSAPHSCTLRRINRFSCVIFLVLLGTAFSNGKPGCAVLPFDNRGDLSSENILTLTDRFVVELQKLGVFAIIPRSKMEEVLKLQKYSWSEFCSSEHAMEAGKLLAVQRMVYGSVGLIGGSYSFNAYMVEVETGATLVSGTVDCKDLKQLLNYGMGAVAAQLATVAQSDELALDSPPEVEAAPDNCNTIVITHPGHGTLWMKTKSGFTKYPLSKPAKLYLPVGHHPFRLAVPGRDTIYGAFDIHLVTEQTRLFQMGNISDVLLFPTDKLDGVWRGSPVSGQVRLALPTGSLIPLTYTLSLNPIN